MLQWVMDEAASRTGTDEEIATRVMLINFASIHTVALVNVLSLCGGTSTRANLLACFAPLPGPGVQPRDPPPGRRARARRSHARGDGEDRGRGGVDEGVAREDDQARRLPPRVAAPQRLQPPCVLPLPSACTLHHALSRADHMLTICCCCCLQWRCCARRWST